MQTRERLGHGRTREEANGGFTMIELLIVIVVLGILAAIVVFALGGVTGESAAAACQSDARTVGVGAGALKAENPKLTSLTAGTLTSGTWSVGSWEADMLSKAKITGLIGNPYVQSWPTSSSYTIQVASGATVSTMYDISGHGTSAVIAAKATEKPVYGDVLVTGTGTGDADSSHTYDATVSPVEACNFATLGHG